MKTCFRCNVQKPSDEFYRHPKMADGRLNKCKSCAKQDVIANRLANADRYKEYDRSRGFRETNAGRTKARRAVSHAIAMGRLMRPSACAVCEKQCLPDAHHDDYTKPLQVRWLCRSCHMLIHARVKSF